MQKACPLPAVAKAAPATYAGLFLATLATMMFEIHLTRIFSVTMWYHFAFFAISLAMFGMTVGALAVYLLPRSLPAGRTKHDLAFASLLCALTMVGAFLAHLKIPFILYGDKLAGLGNVALTYCLIAVPFVFSGGVVCLALTRFPGQVGRLYGMDLAGAALGCILLIYLLDWTDGPTAVVFIAAIAAAAAVCFAWDARCPRMRNAAVVVALLLLAAGIWNTLLVARQEPLLRLRNVKGRVEASPLYEKWNSFSRIHVFGDPAEVRKPFGWGLSEAIPDDLRVRELQLQIDAEAGTVLTAYDGNPARLEHLKYDVTNLAHPLRPKADVLIVGSGGGRDVLAALAFNQKTVRAVEINRNIIDAVNGRFGDFTGHLDRDPRVSFINDEARSFIARDQNRYDVLQISLIDTWAATAAGAYVLTESALYTREAWKTFLERLNPRGILTFSRWYFRERPGEMYRLVALAAAALKDIGVDTPRAHVLIARRMHDDFTGAAGPGAEPREAPEGVGTILVSRDPFSAQDIDTFESICRRMRFDVVLSPRFAIDSTFERLASGRDLAAFTRDYPINIAPPTDDSPFFFHMLRLRDVLHPDAWQQGMMTFNMKAVAVLGVLLLTVFGLTFLCIVVPLLLTARRENFKGTLPLFVFFAGIGLGFMLVEISQMQRLIVFLGHPVYGLSVVLFALLLSSGAGSAFSQRLRTARGLGRCFLLLLAALVLFGLSTPPAVRFFAAASTPLRILVAVALLLPLGFFMGTAFPLGMRLAARCAPGLGPWLFGINGATSVCASVLAIVLSLSFSISATFWTGAACYLAAVAAYAWRARRLDDKGGRP